MLDEVIEVFLCVDSVIASQCVSVSPTLKECGETGVIRLEEEVECRHIAVHGLPQDRHQLAFRQELSIPVDEHSGVDGCIDDVVGNTHLTCSPRPLFLLFIGPHVFLVGEKGKAMLGPKPHEDVGQGRRPCLVCLEQDEARLYLLGLKYEGSSQNLIAIDIWLFGGGG